MLILVENSSLKRPIFTYQPLRILNFKSQMINQISINQCLLENYLILMSHFSKKRQSIFTYQLPITNHVLLTYKNIHKL